MLFGPRSHTQVVVGCGWCFFPHSFRFAEHAMQGDPGIKACDAKRRCIKGLQGPWALLSTAGSRTTFLGSKHFLDQEHDHKLRHKVPLAAPLSPAPILCNPLALSSGLLLGPLISKTSSGWPFGLLACSETQRSASLAAVTAAMPHATHAT